MRYVYTITNRVNGKVYVGQTKNFAKRKAGHLYGARKGCPQLIYRAMRKHGIENFVFEVVEECEDELINEREQHWVTKYDSFNNGYNMTTGGNQNTRVSDQTKRVLSAKNTGKNNPMYGRKNPSRSKLNSTQKGVRRPAQSERLRGRNNPMFGRRGIDSPTFGRRGFLSACSKLT